MIDSTYQTNLSKEYLLNEDGDFEVIKKFTGSSKFAGIYIRTYQPNNPECANLQLKKSTDLKRIIKEKNIDCDNLTVNAVMRQSIWSYYNEDLRLSTVDMLRNSL